MHDDPRNKSFFDAGAFCRVDHIGFNDQVLVEKLRGARGVGHDAAHGGGSKKDSVDLLVRHPGMNVRLAQKIEFAAVRGDDFAVLALQPPHNRRACHAAMSGHPDALSAQVETTHCHALCAIPGQSLSDPTPPSQRPVPGS